MPSAVTKANGIMIALEHVSMPAELTIGDVFLKRLPKIPAKLSTRLLLKAT